MDAAIISFSTARFDVSAERPNEINPIAGESLLLWLADKIQGRVSVPTPETEDWGWYVNIEWDGHAYMLGSSASDDEEDGPPMDGTRRSHADARPPMDGVR